MEPSVISNETSGATAIAEIISPSLTAVDTTAPPDAEVEIDLGEDDNQHEEEQKLISEELNTKVLESERIDLSDLVAAATENIPKTSGPEEPIRHPPGSIMSLSTGSDESAVEEEKFVKIKPCEMESGSSKASSQSGKENLELEEQIQHLNEQLESMKENMKGKEEECQSIKLQLEDILLEKNVEARSISSLTSELKSIKQRQADREEQIDEVTLVLDDLFEQFKSFLSSSSDLNSLDAKLDLLKSLPAHFQRLERDAELKGIELNEVRSQLHELQDEQTDIIGGYQLVTQNFEKLQSEVEEYKLVASESDQLREEFERFREELISKDEDLMEIQSRCDELQENLEKKTEELELVRGQLQEQQNRPLVTIDKEDKSIETDPIPEVSSDTPPPPQSPSAQDEFSFKIKKLKVQCLEKVHLAKAEQRQTKEELSLSIAQNADLAQRLSAQEEQILEKDEAVKQLLSAVQEYQTSIEQKTQEINETLTAKNLEIEHLMATYKSYADGKERQESELVAAIEERDKIIQALRGEVEELKVKQERNEGLRAQLQKREVRWMDRTMQHSVTVDNLVTRIRGQNDRIEALTQETVEGHAAQGQVTDLTSRLEVKGREVDHLRNELSRLSSLVEGTKDSARKEYENKFKEDEMLRESEVLSLQQQIKSLEKELDEVKYSLGKAKESATKSKGDYERLRMEFLGMEGEKQSIELEWHLLTDQLNWKNDIVAKLEGEVKVLNQQIQELSSSLKEQEARAVKAEENLESHVQKVKSAQSQSEVKINERKLQQLLEEVRALNESAIAKDRKVELLQSKISEIESSEMKAFEETFMLKNWIKQLELENGRYQEEVSLLTNSGNDANDNPKVKKIQDETMRLIYVLDERDKRCVQLTVEITRLLEERDELQLKLSSVLKHNLELTSDLHTHRPDGSGDDLPIYKYTDKVELQNKLAQLEDTNFRMNIDLKRERETRKLVQDELLYSQASRMYREREMKARLRDDSKGSPSDPVIHSPAAAVRYPSVHPAPPTNLPEKESLQVVHI